MAAQNPGNCEYGNFLHAGTNNPADFEYGYAAHASGGAVVDEQKIYTKVSGTWEEVLAVWQKRSGTWVKVKVYVKVAGAWVEIYDGT